MAWPRKPGMESPGPRSPEKDWPGNQELEGSEGVLPDTGGTIDGPLGNVSADETVLVIEFAS